MLIDYKTEDFVKVLQDYDVVLHRQDNATLNKSLRVMKRGGHLISISGPPDHHCGREIGSPAVVRTLLRPLSLTVRISARRLCMRYSFLFMKANRAELQSITDLIVSGVMRPVMDKVFPFDDTNDAIAYVEKERAKGKVVVTMRRSST